MKKLVSPIGTLNLSRTVRRALVTLMYGVYFGLLVSRNYLPSEIPNAQLATAQWLMLAGIVIFIVSCIVLNVSTKGLADRFRKTLTGQPLDERQLLLRNQAYFWSYLILGLVMFLFWNTSNDLGFGWTLIALVGLYGSLPTALIAWLEPDPLQDDESSTPESRSVAT